MVQNDILAILQWWLVLFILGVGFLPLTFFLFKPFFDKGYLFSKILAIVITSYITFILGLVHIAPFTQTTILVCFAVLTALFFLLLRKKQHVLNILQQHWRLFLVEELLFGTA